VQNGFFDCCQAGFIHSCPWFLKMPFHDNSKFLAIFFLASIKDTHMRPEERLAICHNLSFIN
ncbi:MAG: hypothetical protein WC159_00825, partial [Sphaerochaetaceae bacterium]